MTTKDELDHWLDAATDAFAEVASTTLGMDGANVLETRVGYPSEGAGSVVAIFTESPLQVGVFGSEPSCQALARTLLGMGPDDGDLPEGDLADALGEIVNIMAGAMKTRMQAGTVRLGLPLYVKGHVESRSAQVKVAKVSVGEHEAEIFMMAQRAA